MLAPRVDLLADALGLDLDVLEAREQFEVCDGDVDVDLWMRTLRPVRRRPVRRRR